MSLFLRNKFQDKAPFIFKKLYERQVDIFHQESFESIRRDDSKLRKYALIKVERGFETYLTDIRNIHIRNSVTKFRLSNHNLMIEKGRHKKIHREHRFCPFCPNMVEDEFHLLFFCPLYRHLRTLFLNPNGNHNFNFYPLEIKFKNLMSEKNRNTCEFIAKSFELRDFLISKPKRTS